MRSETSRARWVTWSLVAANVLSFLWQLAPAGAATEATWALMPARPTLPALLLSMFVHADVARLVNNMVFLACLASLEDLLGHARFLATYLASGVAGGLAFVVWARLASDPTTGTVGASGAIFGLYGCLGRMLAERRLLRRDAGYVATLLWNLAFGLLVPGVALVAHVGGFVAGWLLGPSDGRSGQP